MNNQYIYARCISMKKILLLFILTITFVSTYSQELAIKKSKFVFVKARLMNSLYWVYYPSGDINRFPCNPIQARVGYQISPRVAVQIAFSGRKFKNTFGSTGSDTLGNPVTSQTKSIDKIFDIPLQIKYTFSNPDKRLQFYWLVGVAFVSARYSTTFLNTNGSSITRNETHGEKATNTFASIALGTSYRLSKRWALDLEFGFNKNTDYITTNRIPTGRSMGIGVSYAFR